MILKENTISKNKSIHITIHIGGGVHFPHKQKLRKNFFYGKLFTLFTRYYFSSNSVRYKVNSP